MTASVDLPNKFIGKERDTDFGLDWDYFGARYYDAVVGRFLSVDPQADRFSSFSPYNYALNSPIRVIDPDGESPVVVVGGVALGAGELAVLGLGSLAFVASTVGADGAAQDFQGAATSVDENVVQPLVGLINSGVEATKGFFDNLVNTFSKGITSSPNQAKAGDSQAKGEQDKNKQDIKEQNRQNEEFNRENRKVDNKSDLDRFTEDIQKLSPKNQRTKNLVEAAGKLLNKAAEVLKD